jgi:hypothetical protein
MALFDMTQGLTLPMAPGQGGIPTNAAAPTQPAAQPEDTSAPSASPGSLWEQPSQEEKSAHSKATLLASLTALFPFLIPMAGMAGRSANQLTKERMTRNTQEDPTAANALLEQRRKLLEGQEGLLKGKGELTQAQTELTQAKAGVAAKEKALSTDQTFGEIIGRIQKGTHTDSDIEAGKAALLYKAISSSDPTMMVRLPAILQEFEKNRGTIKRAKGKAGLGKGVVGGGAAGGANVSIPPEVVSAFGRAKNAKAAQYTDKKAGIKYTMENGTIVGKKLTE